MVTIVDYKQRENEDGESFFVLVIQGGLEMVKSQESNRYYATARKANVPSTFNEITCKGLVGSQMPGKIQKVETDPYEYTVEETGEILELNFRYEYVPEEDKDNIPTDGMSSSTIDDFIPQKPELSLSANEG